MQVSLTVKTRRKSRTEKTRKEQRKQEEIWLTTIAVTWSKSTDKPTMRERDERFFYYL